MTDLLVVEDAIVALLAAEFGENRVRSNPFGSGDIIGATQDHQLIVTYAGSTASANTEFTSGQDRTMRWSILCVAKNYTAAKRRQRGALSVLMAARRLLSGAFLMDEYRLTAGNDRLMPLDQNKYRGQIAYELVVSLSYHQ